MNRNQRLNHPLLIPPVCRSAGAAASGQSLAWRLVSLLVMLVASWCVFSSGQVVAQSAVSGKAQPMLPTVQLLIDGTPLQVEVASTSEQRYMGLSFRTELADDAGMMFAYPAERKLTFTMRNTLIPLSIAFISSDMIINEIHDMNVGPGQLFDSRDAAQFALEVNQGWFERHGIGPGARIVMH